MESKDIISITMLLIIWSLWIFLVRVWTYEFRWNEFRKRYGLRGGYSQRTMYFTLFLMTLVALCLSSVSIYIRG